MIRRFKVPAALALLLTSPAARAEELGLLGHDARVSSVAGASVALGASPGVTYTNPALLAGARPQVSFGVLIFRPSVSAALLGPSAPGVPRSIYGSTVGLDQGRDGRSLPAAELPSRRADNLIDRAEVRLGVGATARLLDGRLGVGVVAGLPAFGGDRPNLSTHYADEREAAFSNRVWPLRLGGWQRVADAILGASYRVTPWLDVGLAGQAEAAVVARIGVYVPDASVQDTVNSTMSTSVETALRPILGARASLGRRLSLGVAFRGESYFSVDAASEVTLWNYHQASDTSTRLQRSTQKIPVVFGYKPLELAAALGGSFGAVEVEVTATFQRWSRYLDAHGQRPEQAAVFPAGYESSIPFDAGAFRFRDVVAPALGVRVRQAPWAQLSAGASYQPSPVPPQVGRTSYADSDILGLAAGQRLSSGPWSLDVALQLWVLSTRTTYKERVVDEMPDSTRSLADGRPMPEAEGLQTNNPGYPGYTIRGALLGGSLFLSRQF